MQRYFIELFYKGTNYSGLQTQRNANTIQAEVEKALGIYFKKIFELTGSSRTDAGVHALQNFFHFDHSGHLDENDIEKSVYHLNAILPSDIVIRKIFRVKNDVHCRFHAKSRTYCYSIYQQKNPFLAPMAFYYPYQIDIDILNLAGAILINYTDFESFAKRNSQVHTFNCTISKSEWKLDENGMLKYTIIANRFLRGMVRGLVGTMLKVGRKKISLSEFKEIIEGKQNEFVDFSMPPQGLMLLNVEF